MSRADFSRFWLRTKGEREGNSWKWITRFKEGLGFVLFFFFPFPKGKRIESLNPDPKKSMEIVVET